jgi:hypothetical protein
MCGASTKRANPKFRGHAGGWFCAKSEISGWVSWGLFFGSFLWTSKEMNAVGRHAPQATINLRFPYHWSQASV